MESDDLQQEPEYQFDVNSMETNAQISDLWQEGNWLKGTTNHGVRFTQRIPAGKMLNKNEKGEWIFEDLREVA